LGPYLPYAPNLKRVAIRVGAVFDGVLKLICDKNPVLLDQYMSSPTVSRIVECGENILDNQKNIVVRIINMKQRLTTTPTISP